MSTESLDTHDEVSFAYYFRWDCPDVHIKQALRNLLSNCAAAQSGQNEKQRRDYEQEVDRVRWLIATNPNTPSQVLEHLVKKSNAALLERIAENPRASAKTLRQLADYSSPEVRAAVAENLNAPIDALEVLATDENADVRYRLAENPNIPEELLKLLCEDDNPYVAHRASKTVAKLTVAEPTTVSTPLYTLPWQRSAEM